VFPGCWHWISLEIPLEMPKGANFAFIPTSSRGKKFDETQSANGCRREWKLA